MNGLLVYHTIQTQVQSDRLNRLIKSFQNKGVTIVTTNQQNIIRLLETSSPGYFNFAYLLDEDIQLAKAIEINHNVSVFNTETPIQIAADRALLTLILRDQSIPTPKTIIFPYTMNHSLIHQISEVTRMLKPLAYPYLIKERQTQVKQPFFFIQSHDDLRYALAKVGMRPLIAQEYIGPQSRQIVKIVMLGEKVVAAIEVKTIGEKEKLLKIKPTKPIVQCAKATMKAIGADICLVTMLVQNKAIPYVYGVQTTFDPYPIEQATGVRITEKMTNYIIEQTMLR
jgi:hypothetical protein